MQFLKLINPHINALMKASNIDKNKAKTLFYYCMMTWALNEDIHKKPILLITGESGTGKNELMELMYNWCLHEKKDSKKSRPEWIKGDQITEAQLRDELADTTTAFIEEGDKAKVLKDAENWYKLRYDETSRQKSYRKYSLNKYMKSVYTDEMRNHFGFTVIHAQNPFQTPEFQRRTITVNIEKDETKTYKKSPVVLDPIISDICHEKIHWSSKLEFNLSGSAWDCWEPFLRIATFLDDKKYIEYVFDSIKLKKDEDDSNKFFEPKYVVLAEIIPIYLKRLKGNKNKIAITELRDLVKKRDANLNEMQISKHARNWGFETYRPGGRTNIKVINKKVLEQIAAKAQIPLEDVEEEEVMEPVGIGAAVAV
jgi:hypothetical protein